MSEGIPLICDMMLVLKHLREQQLLLSNFDSTFVSDELCRRVLPKLDEVNNGLGNGCGSVGRAVACNTRGPWFESIYWQNLY